MALLNSYAITSDGNTYSNPPNTTTVIGSKGTATKINETDLLLGVSVTDDHSMVFGSTVVINTDTSTSNDGDMAIMNDKPIAHPFTSTLAGNYPELENSINKIQSVNTRKLTTAIRNNQFNIITGKFTDGYPVVTVDNFDADKATEINRAVPGTLYFSLGKSVVETNYKKKTG